MIKEDLVFTTEENYTAIVKFIHNSHYCGYVGVPKEHKDYGKDYDDIDGIGVHGGLTYAENSLQGFDNKNNLWFFGFDAAHYGDKIAYDDSGIFRDRNYMKTQCEVLSKQLKERE